jgi:hypothetical protein
MLADVKKNDALGQQATATTGGLVLSWNVVAICPLANIFVIY